MIEPGFLARISLFAGLSSSELEMLVPRLYERRYRKGTVIFAEGDPGEAVYFIREGRVKIYRLTPDGVEQIVGVFGEAQPFGLVAVASGTTFPATAEAAEDCRIWVLRKEEMQTLMTGHPKLAHGVLGEVGNRLRRAQERIHSLAVRSVRQRVAEYLLDLARVQIPPGAPAPVRVTLTMTHQELGAYLGASRETITRALADLRRERAVAIDSEDVLLVDTDRLRDWLQP